MRKSHLHLDPIQDLLDFLKVTRELAEKSTVIRTGFIKDLLVYLHVETDKFKIGSYASVNFAVVQLNGTVRHIRLTGDFTV